jgi:hypothetical protein
MSDHTSELIGSKLLHWCKTVADHDYDAAAAYLSINHSMHDVEAYAHALQHATVTTRRSNDILRACHRPGLPLTDPGVLGALKKVLSGKEMSPVLIVNGDIADGYHRVSLAYALDPFDDVPCIIVNL